MTVVTAVCFWLGYEARRASRIRTAVTGIYGGGGRVTYAGRFVDGLWPGERFRRQSRGRSSFVEPAPKWARDAIGEEFFVDVHEVLLSPRATQRGAMNHLPGCREVVSLVIQSDARTLLDLRPLLALPHLTTLHLEVGGQVDWPTLAQLASLRELHVTSHRQTLAAMQTAAATLPKCVTQISVGAGWGVKMHGIVFADVRSPPLPN